MIAIDIRRAAALLLAGLLLPAASGCKGKANRADVSGKVTINGKEVKRAGGRITFQGSDGLPLSFDVAEDGSYKASGVLVGENGVGVTYANPDAKEPASMPKPKPDEQPRQPATPPSPYLTDLKFADPARSGLKVTVEEGKENSFSPNVIDPTFKGK